MFLLCCGPTELIELIAAVLSQFSSVVKWSFQPMESIQRKGYEELTDRSAVQGGSLEVSIKFSKYVAHTRAKQCVNECSSGPFFLQSCHRLDQHRANGVAFIDHLRTIFGIYIQPL